MGSFVANWVVVEVEREDGGGGGGGDGFGEEQRMGEWNGDALMVDGECELLWFGVEEDDAPSGYRL